MFVTFLIKIDNLLILNLLFHNIKLKMSCNELKELLIEVYKEHKNIHWNNLEEKLTPQLFRYLVKYILLYKGYTDVYLHSEIPNYVRNNFKGIAYYAEVVNIVFSYKKNNYIVYCPFNNSNYTTGNYILGYKCLTFHKVFDSLVYTNYIRGYGNNEFDDVYLDELKEIVNSKLLRYILSVNTLFKLCLFYVNSNIVKFKKIEIDSLVKDIRKHIN